MGLFSSEKLAPLTEKNLQDQSGKVFIVTGSNAGIGRLLTGILYQHNAKIYVATRSAEKANAAIKELQQQYPDSKGELVFLHLDLNDLTGIKASAEEFLRKETKLDVLWNNAGVMVPPQGSVTAQNYEMQLGVNNLGPFLFTKFLTPILVATAKSAPAGTVRVVWVASSAAERFAPAGGVEMNNLDYKNDRSAWHKYGTSKAGNILQGKEFARRFADTGVISLSIDPGVLKTDLYQHLPKWQTGILGFLAMHEPIFGSYTELFAGLSDTITAKDNGAFIKPWGTISTPRKDIGASSNKKADGSAGIAEQFWDWNGKQVAQYA